MAHIKTVSRYHDISAGHRVVGHEGKCRFLHGHNYRVHFECTAPDVDTVGRVIDFGVIKSALCMWLEDNWDHQMLLWEEDPLLLVFRNIKFGTHIGLADEFYTSLVPTFFNPTAENMAAYLLEVIGPQQLEGTGVTLTRVTIDETRKCSATATLDYIIDAPSDIHTS